MRTALAVVAAPAVVAPEAPRRGSPTPPAPPASPVDPVRVILSPSVEMEEAKVVLRCAMVVSITGARPAVTSGDVEEVLYSSLSLQHSDFPIHVHHPEDFLVILSTRELMDRLAGDHFINGPGFTMSLRPWNKLAHAIVDSLDHSVQLELRGIPAQAWHPSTAEHLLGNSCWIERLHPSTRSSSFTS